jgi:ubiquinone biosynthesis O-methyltransferase
MPELTTDGSAILPAAYRTWRASELGRITDRIEEKRLVELIGPVAGKRVLDVGCGDGVLSLRLAEAGGIVTGLDADPAMLTAARQRAATPGAAITFVQGDARSLPVADSSFDVVVTVTVLCFIVDAERAVKEMARVLRPGGRLVIGELGRFSLWAAKRRVSGWLGSHTWRKAHFRTAGELRRIALAAGLEVDDVRGAIYYPPCNVCARLLAPIDEHFGAVTTIGAAFIAIAALKPA